jgi:uncharacterized membrane protein
MAVACIAALWIAFAATHMGLSSLRLRPKLVGALGDLGFQGLYSLVALALFVPLVWVYFANQHAGPHLWYLGQLAAVRWLAYAGMALALSLVVGGILQPSPVGMTGGATRARGVLRISRHPLFMGLGVFGLVHLACANVNAAELVFFAGFPLFAWLGCRHQDARKLATLGEDFRRFHAETPFLPFGRAGRLQGLREMPLAIAIAVALAVLLRSFHPGWFGGAA